jgi:putative transposase
LTKLSSKDEEYRHEGSEISLINFHFVFVPNRGEAVLTEEVALKVQEEIFELAVQNQWKVLSLGIQPDHIHLLVNVTVDDSASKVVESLKGRLPSAWSPSYFVSSVGNVSTATVKQLIESQYTNTHTTRGIND